MKGHPDYKAAKAGDRDAAFRVVSGLMDKDVIERIRGIVAERPVIVVPVAAIEKTGRNQLPTAYAELLADEIGGVTELRFVQTEEVHHGGAGAYHRMAFQPPFDGPVVPGADYIIVDDTVAMGGTLANLKGAIESQGGRVILATTLATRAANKALNIDPSFHMMGTLSRKHGQALEDFLQQEFGYGIESLTEGEAGHLRAAPSVDAIRDRLAEARESAGRGLLQDADRGTEGLAASQASGAEPGRLTRSDYESGIPRGELRLEPTASGWRVAHLDRPIGKIVEAGGRFRPVSGLTNKGLSLDSFDSIEAALDVLTIPAERTMLAPEAPAAEAYRDRLSVLSQTINGIAAQGTFQAAYDAGVVSTISEFTAMRDAALRQRIMVAVETPDRLHFLDLETWPNEKWRPVPSWVEAQVGEQERTEGTEPAPSNSPASVSPRDKQRLASDVEWTPAQAAIAEADGWNVLDIDGTGVLQIQKIDGAGVFINDADARLHVQEAAARGDETARIALEIDNEHSAQAAVLAFGFVPKTRMEYDQWAAWTGRPDDFVAAGKFGLYHLHTAAMEILDARQRRAEREAALPPGSAAPKISMVRILEDREPEWAPAATLDDLLRPSALLVANSVLNTDTDWSVIDEATAAAGRVFPLVTNLIDQDLPDDNRRLAPGEMIVYADPAGWGMRWELPENINPGSRAAGLAHVAARLLAATNARPGETEIGDIEDATVFAKSALRGIGLSASKKAMQKLPADLGTLVKDPAAIGFKIRPENETGPATVNVAASAGRTIPGMTSPADSSAAETLDRAKALGFDTVAGIYPKEQMSEQGTKEGVQGSALAAGGPSIDVINSEFRYETLSAGTSRGPGIASMAVGTFEDGPAEADAVVLLAHGHEKAGNVTAYAMTDGEARAVANLSPLDQAVSGSDPWPRWHAAGAVSWDTWRDRKEAIVATRPDLAAVDGVAGVRSNDGRPLVRGLTAEKEDASALLAMRREPYRGFVVRCGETAHQSVSALVSADRDSLRDCLVKTLQAARAAKTADDRRELGWGEKAVKVAIQRTDVTYPPVRRFEEAHADLEAARDAGGIGSGSLRRLAQTAATAADGVDKAEAVAMDINMKARVADVLYEARRTSKQEGGVEI